MYNRQTPCVFHHIEAMFHGIPKNASTSIKHLLYEANHGKKFDGTIQWVHKGNERGGCVYLPLDEVKSDKFNKYLHFTVARNPYDRFTSFYTDLCLGSTNHRHAMPPFFTDNKIPVRELTINQAVDLVCKYTNDNEIDEHIACQLSFVHVPNVNVLKIESLERDWAACCEKLGIAYCTVPVYNKSTTSITLTEDQKYTIYNRYKKDFERFGYEQ